MTQNASKIQFSNMSQQVYQSRSPKHAYAYSSLIMAVTELLIKPVSEQNHVQIKSVQSALKMREGN